MSQLPEQLLQALHAGGSTQVKRLPGNENENWRLRVDSDYVVVKKLRTHSAANTELEGVYRRALISGGLPVAPYLPLAGQACVLSVGRDNFVATPYVEGTMTKPGKQVVADAATLLAKTHVLSAGGLPDRQNWYCQNYIPDALTLIDDAYADAKRAFVTQFADYPDFWNSKLPKGIMHGDMQADNIIVNDQDEIVGILDWEETGVGPLLLDVAHTAQQLSFERGVCDDVLFETFLAAYQKVRALTDLEKQWFDAALRYTMLVLSVWAHIKKSRGEIDDELFRRVGNYYLAGYATPRVG